MTKESMYIVLRFQTSFSTKIAGVVLTHYQYFFMYVKNKEKTRSKIEMMPLHTQVFLSVMYVYIQALSIHELYAHL